ncbi:MAG: FAD-binding oxidoreductase [Chloroflexota bacterium]|nr:FAD-binding oxidoreductase [Chloroflexota bacterium]
MKKSLAGAVGADDVFDDRETLEHYSNDNSLDSAVLPSYVVWPKDYEQVQKVIGVAREVTMPVVPSSSGVHMYGGAIPRQGGIVMDLRKMNKILDIDKSNRVARIEPGVTWEQLQNVLAEENLMAMIPLLPHAEKSALTSHLEREPQIIPKYEYAEPLMTTETIFPKGDLFRTGAACAGPGIYEHKPGGVLPYGPGLDFWRLLQGAQGTMGVVTWGSVKVEHKSDINRPYFILLDDIQDAIDILYRIGRKMTGQELLLLDNVNLAAILSQGSPQDYHRLVNVLAPWTIIVVISGAVYRPEERMDYEEEELFRIGRDFSLEKIYSALPGVPGAERNLVEQLRNPWPKEETYWKFINKGGSADLFFLTTMEKVPGFVDVLMQSASEFGFLVNEVGCYVQPLEYGRQCHLEFNFAYNHCDPLEVEAVKALYAEAAKRMLTMGAFYSRPYGILADLAYGKATGYTTVLKKLKSAMDPQNIMNPGRLCF